MEDRGWRVLTLEGQVDFDGRCGCMMVLEGACGCPPPTGPGAEGAIDQPELI